MKRLLLLSVIFLTACGLSQEEKENIAAVTCSIMSETRNMDGAVRVEKMNDAREKIGGEPFLRGDDAIKEAFEWGLCQELVLNEIYDETLQPLKDAKRERERIAAETLAEENRIAAEKLAEENRIAAEKRAEEQRIAEEKQRIADSKPTVKEEFHSNGKLKSRKNYKSKNDGEETHGLSEEFHEWGELSKAVNFNDGKKHGLQKVYYSFGQVWITVHFVNGKKEGIQQFYNENGQLGPTSCYKTGEATDMSYCEK
mgnify:CR=1 FL=1